MFGSTLSWWVFLYPLITVTLLLSVTLIARRWPGRGRRTALVVNFSVTGIYLVWRAVDTLPWHDPLGLSIGIILLATETLGAIQTFLFAIALWRPVAPRHVPLPDHGPYPSVDVFITTYNEPESTLRPTLAAAAALRYPGTVTVYLCDDGRRDKLAALAARYGAIHLTRPDNTHAKAGNLNHALNRSSGDLVVTLDADMMPRENFLEESVGLFIEDPELGLAQAPQAFYNEDPFQYNLFAGSRLPNEQDFFMRELQGGYERFNSTMYVGSNAIMRRSAIEEIGGFVTGGLTEDFATGLLLQTHGIRIAYIGEVIAAGLAPEDIADLITQRDRWCRGAIQCAKTWNAFTVRGLTLIQRLVYANRIMYWYFGVFKAIYLYTPLLFLLFGIPALVTDVWHLLVFWVPYYIASFTAFRILSGGRRSFTWSHIYELAMGPALAVSAVSETVGLSTSRFTVTPKGVTSDQRVVHWRLIAPHLIFLGLAFAGLLNVFWWNRESFPLEGSLIPAAWTLYNMEGAIMAVLVFVQRPRLRLGERTLVNIAAELHPVGHFAEPSTPILIDDLSFVGARVKIAASEMRAGFPHGALLTLPTSARLEGSVSGAAANSGVSGDPTDEHNAPNGHETPDAPVTVMCEVVWAAEDARSRSGAASSETATAHLGLRFIDPSPTAEIRITQLITASPGWVRHDRETHAHLAGVTRSVSRGLSQPLESHRRRDLRFSSELQGAATLIIEASGEAVPARLIDLSPSGAQVEVSDAHTLGLERGTLVRFENDQADDNLSGSPAFTGFSEVRWCRDAGGTTRLGLRFLTASERSLIEQR